MALIVDYNKQEHTTMSDDGQGKSIKIPSFLIGKQDGNKLKETIHQMTLKEIDVKKLGFIQAQNIFDMLNNATKNGTANSTEEGDQTKRVDFYVGKGHQVIV